VFSESARNRGFIFTIDALLAFFIVIGLNSALLFYLDQGENLNHECLYQLAQDTMEICSMTELSEKCFSILETEGLHYSLFIDGKKKFGEDGMAEVAITRRYTSGVELQVWS